MLTGYLHYPSAGSHSLIKMILASTTIPFTMSFNFLCFISETDRCMFNTFTCAIKGGHCDRTCDSNEDSVLHLCHTDDCLCCVPSEAQFVSYSVFIKWISFICALELTVYNTLVLYWDITLENIAQPSPTLLFHLCFVKVKIGLYRPIFLQRFPCPFYMTW